MVVERESGDVVRHRARLDLARDDDGDRTAFDAGAERHGATAAKPGRSRRITEA